MSDRVDAPTLEASYPNAVDAVRLHECGDYSDIIAPMFSHARTTNKPPAAIRDILVQSAESAVALMPGPMNAAVISQMRTDDFLSYVGAKLGAM